MRKPSYKNHTLLWAVEELLDEPGLIQRPMFGCLAFYLWGRLSLVLADGDEPWNGALVPTSREHHKALMKKVRGLSPHPVLGKWLYLPAETDDFEDSAGEIVRLIRMNDPLIGVEPKPPSAKKKNRAGKTPARKTIRRKHRP